MWGRWPQWGNMKFIIVKKKVPVKYLAVFNYWPKNAYTGISSIHATCFKSQCYMLWKQPYSIGDGKRTRGLSLRSLDFRSWGNGFILGGFPKNFLHGKHTQVEENANFFTAVEFSFELLWHRAEDPVQLRNNSKIKVSVSKCFAI